MKQSKTITFIKPDAFKNHEKIFDIIHNSGFKIIKATEIIRMNRKESEEFCRYFYQQHADKPFFGEIVDYIASGPIIAALLEKDNAIEDFRTLIGDTDPQIAAEGTIRKTYGTNKANNAIHGSDSKEGYLREKPIFFPEE